MICYCLCIFPHPSLLYPLESLISPMRQWDTLEPNSLPSQGYFKRVAVLIRQSGKEQFIVFLRKISTLLTIGKSSFSKSRCFVHPEDLCKQSHLKLSSHPL